MQNLKSVYMESRLWTCLTIRFLDDVKSRYHYEEKDSELLKCVASDMISCVKWQEGIYIMLPERDGESGAEEVFAEICPKGTAAAVMTLGAGVDMLQERYQKSGRLLESYMAESIAGELLMLGYEQFAQWVKSETGCHVRAYHFPGSEEGYPIAMVQKVLEAFAQKRVVCNSAFCLTPKKSVVFFAELSGQAAEGCIRICEACSKRAVCSVRTDIREERSMQDVSGSVVWL